METYSPLTSWSGRWKIEFPIKIGWDFCIIIWASPHSIPVVLIYSLICCSAYIPATILSKNILVSLIQLIVR